MPRNPTTGVFTRVVNSFSDPVFGTLIDPTDATSLFDDYDAGLTNSVPKEPILVTTGSSSIAAGVPVVAIQRVAPATTALALPKVADQDGVPLRIVDWSTSVTDHAITMTPNGTEKIMLAATFAINSNASQLASITLYPSTVLNGWYTAP